MNEHDDALTPAIERLLEPLVQLMMRNGLAHGAFSEIAKRVYVRVAREEGRIAGRKQTISRMSILTGLTRKDVARLSKPAEDMHPHDSAGYNRAARVITGWIRDERFTDEQGEPRPLEIDGDGDDFSELVRAFSGDMPPRAVLDELERVGAVERDGDGRVTLEVRAYLPRSGEAEKLGILGADVAGLISTIRHNLDDQDQDPYFQRKVFYDNLPQDCLSELKDLTAKHGQELLERLDRWMAEHDLDANPQPGATGGGRAGIGVYYFQENDEESESS
jgi:hypothetical protein